MTGAIVLRWGGAKVGRETKALETFAKALAYYDGLAKEGRIHAHHEYFSLTGKVGGFAIIEGQVDDLLRIQTEETSMRLLTEAGVTVEDFTIDTYVGGSESAVQHQVTLFGETLQSQGLLA
jgi:hypothetical protein